MPLVIGTDEAGYAPNLGPLVVGASAWTVPDWEFDFYGQFADRISSDSDPSGKRLQIADSKAVYRSGSTLESLESAVLSLLACSGHAPCRIDELLQIVSPGCFVDIPSSYQWSDDRLPVACPVDRVVDQGSSLQSICRDRAVRLERISAKLVFPETFNTLLESFGNKANLLSTITLKLVRELLEVCEEDCLIVCDRHGGRARYGSLIQQLLSESWIQVLEESSTISRYQWTDQGKRREIRFLVRGESFLPTAVASMTAKYLRELMMMGWNGFWRLHDSSLQPTAGYPGDAKRFLKDVSPILKRLRIKRTSIWRAK